MGYDGDEALRLGWRDETATLHATRRLLEKSSTVKDPEIKRLERSRVSNEQSVRRGVEVQDLSMSTRATLACTIQIM